MGDTRGSMGDTREGRGAVRAYYGLAVAALLLPLLVLCGGGWMAWQAVLRDARQGLDSALAVSTEQATKVLDTHMLVAARVNDLVSSLDDAAIRAHEAQLRDQIVAMIRPFPQVTAVIVGNADGQALLATRQIAFHRSPQPAGFISKVAVYFGGPFWFTGLGLARLSR